MGAYAAIKLNDKVWIGFANNSYFGLSENYDYDWVGRYYVQNSTIAGISFIPSIGVQLTDNLSVGAGLNAMYGIFSNSVAINNPNPLLGDGQMNHSRVIVV